MALAYLQERQDSEHEQILIRIGFAVLILIYIVAYMMTRTIAGDRPTITNWICVLINVGYLGGSLLLLGHVLSNPDVKPRRRYVGMLLDLVALTVAMIVGGALVAPLYPMFLWITFGMGLRYGMTYLFASAGLSVTGFGLVIAATPFWRGQPALSVALLLALIALPLYVAKLIDKPTRAKWRADDASRADSSFPGIMVHKTRAACDASIGMTDLEHPPKGAQRLLRWLLPRGCRNQEIENLEKEYFQEMLPHYAARESILWYWWQAVCTIIVAWRHALVGSLILAGFAKIAQWLWHKFGG